MDPTTANLLSMTHTSNRGRVNNFTVECDSLMRGHPPVEEGHHNLHMLGTVATMILGLEQANPAVATAYLGATAAGKAEIAASRTAVRMYEAPPPPPAQIVVLHPATATATATASAMALPSAQTIITPHYTHAPVLPASAPAVPAVPALVDHYDYFTGDGTGNLVIAEDTSDNSDDRSTPDTHSTSGGFSPPAAAAAAAASAANSSSSPPAAKRARRSSYGDDFDAEEGRLFRTLVDGRKLCLVEACMISVSDGGFRRHLKTHTKLLPHWCFFCAKRMTEFYNVANHMYSTHVQSKDGNFVIPYSLLHGIFKVKAQDGVNQIMNKQTSIPYKMPEDCGCTKPWICEPANKDEGKVPNLEKYKKLVEVVDAAEAQRRCHVETAICTHWIRPEPREPKAAKM